MSGFRNASFASRLFPFFPLFELDPINEIGVGVPTSGASGLLSVSGFGGASFASRLFPLFPLFELDPLNEIGFGVPTNGIGASEGGFVCFTLDLPLLRGRR